MAKDTNEGKAPTKKAKCVCPHTGQDALYGRNIRIWNRGHGRVSWRCTVCGRET